MLPDILLKLQAQNDFGNGFGNNLSIDLDHAVYRPSFFPVYTYIVRNSWNLLMSIYFYRLYILALLRKTVALVAFSL
nr:MAG TPA: hypothetical protein [Caudoviricetes sp.]